jgi:glycosyltransferase involved in cell wall biosynthesis
MSSGPKISICLPNLNTRPFLPARLESIRAQTFTDWELVVSDNFSEDGAWEFFQAAARADARILIAQAPRGGMYDNWNNCVRRARGEYVYIATSDDTMMPACLERLAAALDRLPGCGLASCRAMGIDREGRELPDWWPTREAARFFGEWMERAHIRPAPHDGILHAALGMVYDSVTQLLIRRTVFERVGLFRTDFGSQADLEWEMRASLVTDTVHVPETLATWRIHAQQATQDATFLQPRAWENVTAMIGHALDAARAVAPANTARLSRGRLQCYHAWHAYQLALRGATTPGQKLRCLARHASRHVSVLQRALQCAVRREPFHVPDRQAWARALLRECGAPALRAA